MEDLPALLRGGPLDAATIERLRHVDRDQLREALRAHLDDDTVEGILRRIDQLLG